MSGHLRAAAGYTLGVLAGSMLDIHGCAETIAITWALVTALYIGRREGREEVEP